MLLNEAELENESLYLIAYSHPFNSLRSGDHLGSARM